MNDLGKEEQIFEVKEKSMQHEVEVPFGCHPQQIELALLKFITTLLASPHMLNVKKLFFVPVGLPGMGKSTLAKHIRQTTEKHLNSDPKSR